ncbi:aminoglycoside phosphotransferase (APT) family kinase protein [Scopulibacillus darangshiensis]|uniref:Aminoglycoside phosphotransferase (APT) family kinase protein n=1 Tax=Scopulibacillus darangshiensis TaxID=442528 RepID=A0A4V2SKP5_9BACL|nr:phosphotransferase [Scopulibacillus darangshiensis]TCP20336.1 aminoglycoside phosphotransferase (APT) family kinase protein [Scopulibacillus darangshiensis]
MNEPWTPEQVVSERAAAGLIAAQFPALPPLSIVEYGKGFDNTVYLVNNDYIFRFPRRQIAVELLKTESSLLPKLVNFLPLSIPEPVFLGKPSDDYPWPFTGYKVVRGDTPGKLTRAQHMGAAEPIAHFLRKLHSFPVEMAERCGVKQDALGRIDLAKRIPMLEENVKKLGAFGVWENIGQLENYLESLCVVKPTGKAVLTHGDIHIRNIVVNKRGVLSGVIDWGDTHIGDPAVDLAFIYSFLPPEGRQIFFNIYGEVDVSTKKIARFKAIYTTVLLLLYGHDHNDDKLVAAARDSLNLALEG